MANDFKPNVGSRVPKADAKKWIAKFDKERKKDTKSVFYGRDTLLKILSDPTISGISFFFCRKPKKDGNGDYDDLVLIGTTEDGKLVWGDDTNLNAKDGGGGGSYENGMACPPWCPVVDPD